MNPLTYLPSSVRAPFYAVVAFASLGFTAAAAGFTAIHQAVPKWDAFGLAAMGVVAGATGLVALANVTPDRAVGTTTVEVQPAVVSHGVDPAAAAATDNAGDDQVEFDDPVVDVDEPGDVPAIQD